MESTVYLNWIRKQPCAVCGDDTVIHAHHLIGDGHGAMALKNWDVTAIPLCPMHHAELHQKGSDAWELQYGMTQCEMVVQTIKRAVFEGVIQIVPKRLQAA
jgi:hypothetical protein